METKEKTVFMEYSSSNPGQHFMTVMQQVEGQKVVIGRISRFYDKDNNKMTYKAVDGKNVSLFEDTPDIYTLKKRFIEHGHDLAMAVEIQPMEVKERAPEIKAIREEKEEKNKSREKEIEP
jgi:hypothetical protein